jgi:hypothetical protein
MLSVIFGAFTMIWPLRTEVSLVPIVLGGLIIAAGCWFNGKAQRLRREWK